MKIKLNSIFVENQDQALLFYTTVLGFIKKNDIPAGSDKWLTVVSPDDINGTELSLEPNSLPVAKTYQSELFRQGIPATAFAVEDTQLEYDRLIDKGVTFVTPPTDAGTTIIAVFDDSCGNLIQIYQG